MFASCVSKIESVLAQPMAFRCCTKQCQLKAYHVHFHIESSNWTQIKSLNCPRSELEWVYLIQIFLIYKRIIITHIIKLDLSFVITKLSIK